MILCWLLINSALAQVSTGERRALDGSPESLGSTRVAPVISAKGMVVADDRVAADWGAEILRRGGNAVDAAVATAFAMAVTRPHFASIGGGGFLLYCPAKRECEALDYRERAPLSVTRETYLLDGKPNPARARVGWLASGTPGVVAGLLDALGSWGTRKAPEILSRPRELARKGVELTPFMETALVRKWKDETNPALKAIWGCGDKPCVVGKRIVQSDLEKVLAEISKKGRAGFYSGWVAKRIMSSGALISEKDLKEYKPALRKPLVSKVLGMQVVSMPPPSSGGIALLQMLGFVERSKGAFSEGWGSLKWIQTFSQAMQRAFADRAAYLGDPDFVKVPLEKLLSSSYLDDRWSGAEGASRWRAVSGGGIEDGDHTTHLSVVDRAGNAVALTTTVNDAFGSGYVVPGTGIVMNNEMDDFSLDASTANQFGLVGSEANFIAAGKRPLSSMTPTIAREDGEVRLVLGGAGGPRIISAVTQVLLNRWVGGMSLPDAIHSPRIHHQWNPDVLSFERGALNSETRTALGSWGLTAKEVPASLARVYALERFANGRVWASPDPRGEGAAIAE